jgi:hypothetical protein
VKGIVEVRAQGAPARASITGIPTSPGARRQLPERRREGLLAEPEVGDTVVRHNTVTPDERGAAQRDRPDRKWSLAAAALVLVVAGVGVAALSGGGGDASDDAEIDPPVFNDGFDDAPVAVAPSPVPEIVVTEEADGTRRFSWAARAEDVTYAVTVDDSTTAEVIDDNEYVAAADCIEVEVIADTGLVSAPTRGCA